MNHQRVANLKMRLLETIGGSKSYEEIAQHIVQICSNLMETEICTLWRVYFEEQGGRSLRLMAAHGVVAPKTLAQEAVYQIPKHAGNCQGITALVACTKTPVRVNSFEELLERFGHFHAGLMDSIQWENEPENRMRNLLAIPVLLGSEVVGVLKVENRTGNRGFHAEDEETLKRFLEPVAVSCKWMLLLDEQEQIHIEAPNRFTEALIRPDVSEHLTQEIVNTTAETLKAELCSLWSVDVDAAGEFLVHKASFGITGKSERLPTYRLPENPEIVDDENIEGMTAWVAARRQPFWANSHKELQEHPSWRGSWDIWMRTENTFRSLYAVPLVWQDELLGVLKVENPTDKHHFSKADHQKFQLLANLVVLLLVISRQMKVSLLPEMAHILKSPVAGLVANINGLQEELMQEEPNGQIIKQYFEFLKKGTMTLDVISRTLSAQMLRAGKEQGEDFYDLVAILNSCTNNVKQMVPKGIDVKFIVKDTPPKIRLSSSEQTWIELVIFNLLHNAIKYSPDGETVEMTIERCSGKYRILVEDKGPGIADDDLLLIFESGFKRKARNWPEGTGLGLFTVRDRLNQLGWTVDAQNRETEGTGARFIVEIPEDWRNIEDED